ncbi:MAG: cobaltochelatase subunit CobN [Odoribacteraceae bacterium]|jgi:cobaltochelatase CobN|nr:cobaltochelatase subunit CobN [Odoribacteraceae bacterium]
MKKWIITLTLLAAIIAAGVVVYNRYLATTRVAFVNYQAITLGQIARANDNPRVQVREVTVEELGRLGRYDMVFINGMGLRVVEEQRAQIRRAAERGVPILTTMATNPANNISSLDSVHRARLAAYLGGGQRNYRGLLNYVRAEVDRKLTSLREYGEVERRSPDYIYHSLPSGDELEFASVEEYERFARAGGLWREGGKRVVITGQMSDPSGLIDALEAAGMNVYPLSSFRRLEEFLRAISPDAVINLPHGRMGDRVVEFLRERNIPLFAPLTVNSLVEDWENDPMGMSGGFLSQSVVTPEIDGALRSFALFAQYRDDDGLLRSFAIPERLATFTRTVQAYLALASKPNAEKRVAIFYFKGPGQNAMVAGGMEVAPSLYNLLKKLKDEGYRVDNLPADHRALERMIMQQGAVFGAYAEGALDKFAREANPEWITREEYQTWARASLRPAKLAEVGEFPGAYLGDREGQRLGIARLQFGNIALLPQPAAGSGSNSFQVIHGTNAAPPHAYIAPYLWAQHGFKADAMLHFGTHGSLEFTPKKQVALGSNDWPDRLVGALPHFYVYTISNVGEGVIAKRRSYAGLQSHLTPPFLESNVRGIYRELTEKIKIYNNRPETDRDRAADDVKRVVMQLGIHRELGLDSSATARYSADEVLRVENFAEELATEKITGQLYAMGVPYEPARVNSSVVAMTVDPIAYSLRALDRIRGKVEGNATDNRARFNRQYLEPARRLVDELIATPAPVTDDRLCRLAGVTADELALAREIVASRDAPSGMMAMMMGGAPRGPAKEYTKEETAFALALLEVDRALNSILDYRVKLRESPAAELRSLVNALAGGYTSPSPGGDPVANPNTLPTGRNLYAINAEATPSESAWDKGVQLAKNTIDLYRQRHDGAFPREVSYTLWSSEFIETGGATIAQVLYMLGVEPIRDAFDRVSDLRLIPSAELGRPRVDVVVQTSGQLRDIAASRLFLINRAVEMAAAADDQHENFVASGVVASERRLMERGLSPREARELSSFRVFGGLNGGYGTGIQGMVESGDRWEDEAEIATTYINNMGAFYGSEKGWELFRQFAFEAALTRVDVVIQPRQSNAWGALSLDHVYEFMGGINLAARHVTGKDPDAYFSDYRNRNNARVQELKESIGVESRTTIFNPAYIREKMKGEASSAGEFAEIVRNTYGWNVMKPSVIDKELWDEIFNVYVRDKFDLGIREFFQQQNPAALEEITAVMMETARKGYWKASDEQLAEIARLHTDLVATYLPSCSGFVCDNAKLRDFIAARSPADAAAYRSAISQVREVAIDQTDRGVVLKKEEDNPAAPSAPSDDDTNSALVAFAALAAFILVAFLLLRARRKR